MVDDGGATRIGDFGLSTIRRTTASDQTEIGEFLDASLVVSQSGTIDVTHFALTMYEVSFSASFDGRIFTIGNTRRF